MIAVRYIPNTEWQFKFFIIGEIIHEIEIHLDKKHFHDGSRHCHPPPYLR